MDNSGSNQSRRLGTESLGSNHQQYDLARSPANQQNAAKNPVPFPWNLTRFYDMTDEGPWFPRGIVPASSPAWQGNGPAFQNYRSSGPLASECDTANDDSGYGGSGAPYSIEDTSVIEDDPSTDAHNAAQLIDSFHLGTIQNAPIASWPTTRSIATAPPNAEHKYYCSHCDTWLRTKSELNKHDSRHKKPFHCEVAGCNRKEGFGTRNDLDRHKRSVHSDLSVSGPRYICRIGQCATKGQPKLWPRADNFRSHLRRIHQKDYSPDDDLDEYIFRPAMPRQPALREELQGVGGTALSYMSTNQSSGMQKPSVPSLGQPLLGGQPMATDSRHGIPELHEDLECILQSSTGASSEKMSQSTLASTQDSDEVFMSSGILNGMGQGQLQPHRSFSDQMLSLPTDRYTFPHASQVAMSGDGDMSVANEDDVQSRTDVTEPPEHGDERDDLFEIGVNHPRRPEMARSRTEQSDVKMSDTELERTSPKSGHGPGIDLTSLLGLNKNPQMILEYLKTVPKELLKTALHGDADDVKSSSSSQDSTNQKTPHHCPDCPKTFNRQCELKKHRKRHEKPYGCTFRQCTKSFGSKNDWKRHESSQHWQLETWKCEETKLGQSEVCAKVCFRRESFRNHLHKEHTMTDTKQVEEKLDRCRIGRHCDTRFWCGFCQTIVEIEGQGVNAWTKRCDHIDNHFCGRENQPKMNISQWKYLEDDDKRDNGHAELSTQSSKTQCSLSRSSSTSSNLKRKLETDEDSTSSHKKQRQETVYMWQCCLCSVDVNLKTSTSCYNCDHRKCDATCAVFPVEGRTEDDVDGNE